MPNGKKRRFPCERCGYLMELNLGLCLKCKVEIRNEQASSVGE